MTYYPGCYRPRHSAVVAVEKRYLDIPSLHQKLAMYFDYWPACSVDFWRALQDNAPSRLGSRVMLRQAREPNLQPRNPYRPVIGPGRHQPYEPYDITEDTT